MSTFWYSLVQIGLLVFFKKTVFVVIVFGTNEYNLVLYVPVGTFLDFPGTIGYLSTFFCC